MQNGHGRERGGYVEVGFSKKTVRCKYLGEQMSSGGRGAIVLDPLKSAAL